jgi:hypothetical protein
MHDNGALLAQARDSHRWPMPAAPIKRYSGHHRIAANLGLPRPSGVSACHAGARAPACGRRASTPAPVAHGGGRGRGPGPHAPVAEATASLGLGAPAHSRPPQSTCVRHGPGRLRRYRAPGPARITGQGSGARRGYDQESPLCSRGERQAMTGIHRKCCAIRRIQRASHYHSVNHAPAVLVGWAFA